MLKKNKIIIISLSIVMVLYVLSYYLIINLKPNFLRNNDSVKPVYSIVYMPLRKIDATFPAHLDGINEGNSVIFEGCNGYGTKIFFRYKSNSYALRANSDDVARVALNCTEEQKIHIHIRYSLTTDDSFNNFFHPSIDKISLENRGQSPILEQINR
ncbi:MAG: hypothetical protein JEZ07_17495 [Phycisphaerae bacterium]|nr:hypothetical protein [Phycisphaerae bacterium]